MSQGSNKKKDRGGFSEKGGRGGYRSPSPRPPPPSHFEGRNTYHPPPQAAGYTQPQTSQPYPSYSASPAPSQYPAGPPQYIHATPQYPAAPQYAATPQYAAPQYTAPPQYAAAPQYAALPQYAAAPQYPAPVHYAAPQQAPQIISVSIQTPQPAAPQPTPHYQPPPPPPPPPPPQHHQPPLLHYQPPQQHYQPPAPPHYQPHPQAQPAPSRFHDPHTRNQQNPHSSSFSQKSYPPAPQRKPYSGPTENDRGDRYNNKAQNQSRPQSRDRSSPNPRAFETGSRSSANRQNVNYQKDLNEGKQQRYNKNDNKNQKSEQEKDPPPSFNRSQSGQSERFSSSRGGRNIPPHERRPNPDMQNTNFQERSANFTGRRTSNTSQSSESVNNRRLFSDDPPPSYDSLYAREAPSSSHNSQRANTPGYSSQRGQPSRGRAKHIERRVRDDGQTESVQQTNEPNSKHESALKNRQAAGRGRPKPTTHQPAGSDEASVENKAFDSPRGPRGRGRGRGLGRGRGRGQFKPRGHSDRIDGFERENSKDSTDVNMLLNLESQLKNTVITDKNTDDKANIKLDKAADAENTGKIKKKKRKKKPVKPLQPASENLLNDGSTQHVTTAKFQIMSSFTDDASLREAVELCVDQSATAVFEIVSSSVSCSEGESECTVRVSSENYQVGRRIIMSLCKRLKEHLKSRVMYDISCLEMDSVSASGDEHAVQGVPISNPISKDMKVSDADSEAGTKESLNPDQVDPNKMQGEMPEVEDISEGSTEEDGQSTDDEDAEKPLGEDSCELEVDYEDENETYEEEEIIEGEEGEDFDEDEQEEGGGNDSYEELEEDYPEKSEEDEEILVPEDHGKLTEATLNLQSETKMNPGQDNTCEISEDLEMCVLSDLKSMPTSTKISLVVNEVFFSEVDLKYFLTLILKNANQIFSFALLPDTFMAATTTTLCDLIVPNREDAKNLVKIFNTTKLQGVVIRSMILDE